jgi:glycosyltransferase involved in cell wall biosynthesis
MHAVVIIPAFNEEASLPLVLKAIPRGLVREVIVVDNGSSDRTAEVARSLGATLLREDRRGYGRACLKGLEYLRIKRADVAIFLDADYSDHPEEMPRLVDPLRRDQADLVVGSRSRGAREPGSMRPQALFGNWLATRLMRLFYGGSFTDLGPFRAIRFESLLALRMEDTNYGWTAEMQVKALRHGLRTMEVPVSYRRRLGVSKITGTWSGTLGAGTKILWTIFKNLV